ncbi:MAG: hypothetical protein ACRDL2_09895 [Gaiellaceae bacterium]
MIVAGIEPDAEFVHWWFATGFLILALFLYAEILVGPDVWARRPWRRYLWPGTCFLLGVLMWPVMAFYTNSMIHMVAHGSWAQALMVAGGAELGLVRGKLHSQYWRLTSFVGLLVSGVALLVHEQNTWLFARTAFLHHTLGWLAIVASVFPLMQALRPRSLVAASGFATTFAIIAVLLFCDRDVAPIFGHLSSYAGVPHR